MSHNSAQQDPMSWFITQGTFTPHPHQIHYTEQKCNIESERCNHTFQEKKNLLVPYKCICTDIRVVILLTK